MSLIPTVLTQPPTTRAIEIWKQCPILNPKYMVSDRGRFGKYLANNEFKYIEGKKYENGYIYVQAERLGTTEKQLFTVHKLVANTFLDLPQTLPKGITPQDLVINHKFPDKTCNLAENLEWTTIKENNRHARQSLLFKMSKLAKKVVCHHEKTNKLRLFASIADAANANKVSAATIKNWIANNKRVDGCVWMFKDDVSPDLAKKLPQCETVKRVRNQDIRKFTN